MTLGEALDLIRSRENAARSREIFLACGFEPLHLKTFLQAHFARRFPDERAVIHTGLYGSVQEALATAAESRAEAVIAVIEWSDLDARLGIRGTGGWALSKQSDILDVCRQQCARILAGLKSLSAVKPVAFVLPTLPLPPLGHTPGWRLSASEAELHGLRSALLADSAKLSGIAVLNPSAIARQSPEMSRLDVRMELSAGFPYTLAHASAMAEQVVRLLFPPAPLKGLITDLDDTLWSGIVGEVGVDHVVWDVANRGAVHALYQQMLAHLSEMGVLLAVVSKNEADVAERALKRSDLLVAGERFFPVCANWAPKSSSVAEILRSWNIGPDAVAFVDDSDMEIAEVQAAFPTMNCLLFPKKDPSKTLELIGRLRDLFGKPVIHFEDSLRHTSIRSGAALQAVAAPSQLEFLQRLEGKLTFDWHKDHTNRRPLELINKTNQFNLNGIRISDGEWMRHLAAPTSLVVAVSYEDRLGPLGVIAVVAGDRRDGRLVISSWVMSCRAFSRRIEHHTLCHLFDHCGADRISFNFVPTERNDLVRQFFQQAGSQPDSVDGVVVLKKDLLASCPELPHRIAVSSDSPQLDTAPAPSTVFP